MTRQTVAQWEPLIQVKVDQVKVDQVKVVLTVSLFENDSIIRNDEKAFTFPY